MLYSFLVQYASLNGVTPNHSITLYTFTSIICPHKVPIVMKLCSLSLNFCFILLNAYTTCDCGLCVGGWGRYLMSKQGDILYMVT